MGQRRNVRIIAVVALLCICIMAGYKLYQKIKPSTAHMGLYDYFGVQQGGTSDTTILVLYDKIAVTPALVVNGENYIDFSTLNEEICNKFYWNQNNNYMVVTTPTEFIKVEPSTMDYYVNDKKQTMDNIIIKTQGEKYYVSLSFIKKYINIQADEYDEPKRLVLNYKFGEEINITTARSNGEVRFEDSNKSDILKNVTNGEKLVVLSGTAPLNSGFIRVRTQEGIIGYISEKSINDIKSEVPTNDYAEKEYTRIDKGNVSLGWYMAANQAANNNYGSVMSTVSGVSAIAPTWFGFASKDGEITSIASSDFVTSAHNDGYEVWAVIDDFAENVAGKDIYSNTVSRQKMIKQLIETAKEYKIDGINVDFEHISDESSEHYIQFIRELSVECRKNKLVLTVDTYVPFSYSAFYRWADIAEVVDYLVIMGYDEYHKNSTTPGPAASISWTKTAIDNTINEGVPKEKLIIGIPFYSRYWKLNSSNKITATETLGMQDTVDMLKTAGVTASWDDETQMYYAQYNSAGETVKVWVEGKSSVEAKMKVIDEADVAGTAYWRLGYETSDVWDVISKYKK